MEEMPFKLLLAVLLFGFTLSMGFKALDETKEAEEAASASGALDLVGTKLQIVAVGAPGSRVSVEFKLVGDSKLTLSNEEFGEELFGKVEVETGRGLKDLEVFLLPFGCECGDEDFESIYLPGKHRIAFEQRACEEKRNYISVEGTAGCS